MAAAYCNPYYLRIKSGFRHQCLRIPGRVKEGMVSFWIRPCKTCVCALVMSDSVYSAAQTKLKTTSLLESAFMLPFHIFCAVEKVKNYQKICQKTLRFEKLKTFFLPFYKFCHCFRILVPGNAGRVPLVPFNFKCFVHHIGYIRLF